MTRPSWLRGLFARPATRPIRKKARARTRLILERLEDRTLPVVSIVPGPGNTVGILGTIGDQVWLRTDPAGGSAAPFQYSIDGTNFSNLGVNVGQDATITIGDMGQVHLLNTVGQGHAITFQALGAPSGAAGQLASPNLFTVEGPVSTAGGNLSILNMQGIEVFSNVVVSTRNIGSATDYLNAPSIGDSGSLTFTSENPDTLNPILNIDFNFPHITLDSGAKVLAQVGAGDTTHHPGNVTLSAQNTNSTIVSTFFSAISLLARDASVNLAGATVKGGKVDVESTAGDAGIDPLGELAALGGGNAIWATGAINNLLPFLTSLIPGIPVSFLFKKADATLEVGQGTAQTFDPTAMNATTGEITFASPHNLNTGDPVTYTSSGTAVGGLTSGATYFAIVDSSTTLRLAASQQDALGGVAETGLDSSKASGTQSLRPDSLITGADVNLNSEADSDAEGTAIFDNSSGNISPDAAVHFGLASAGVAFAVAIGIPTAQTLVDPGSQITADGDVHVASTANSTTAPLARVSQNLGGLTADEALKLANATLETQPRQQLAVGVGVNVLTSHAVVSQYASLGAGGNAVIKAAGTNTDKTTVQTASYYDGKVGVTGAFNISSADVQALVDGRVTSGTPASSSNSPTAPVALTFNPFTSVHGSNDPTEPNTIDFGGTDLGLKTGDEITYDSGLGGAVDGLTSGATYYVIDTSVPGDHRIQLALSRRDALAGRNIVVLPPNPMLTDTVTNVTLPFTQVDEAPPYAFDPNTDVSNNAIQFQFRHGLTAGQAVTYTSTGAPLTGLQSGHTYYAIAVDATHIQLAASYANATAASPIAIAISGTGATGTQTITAQTPIQLGFVPGFNNGDPLVYHAAAGKRVNPLVDGQTYYAVTDPNHPNALLLAATQGGTPLQLDLSPVLTSPDGSQTYTITSVDSDSNSFLFNPTLGYQFSAGQPLVYQGALGTKIPGLNSGTTYYAVVDANNPYVIQLAQTPIEAQAASAAATQRSTAASQASTLTAGSTVGTILELNPASNTIVFADPGPGFSTGTALLYHQAPNNYIGGLTDNTTYYAIAVPGDPNSVQLSQSPNGPAIVLDPFSQLTGATAANTQTLDLRGGDPTTSTLNLVSAPTSPVTTGDAFVYHAAVGNGIQGLVDGQTYYAIVLADSTTLHVATSHAGALAGQAIPLSATFTDSSGNSLLIQKVNTRAHTTTLYALLNAPLNTGDAVVYHANGASVPGLLDGASYYVVNNQPGGINPVNFTPGQVATGGSAITVPNHRFYNGEPVTYTTSGTPIGGLATDGTTYYVIVLDSNTIELASSLTNALNGQALTLSQTVASGTQTLTPPAAAGLPVQFAPSPVVDPVAHTITLPGHGFVNGEAVTYTVATGGTPIQSLTPGNIYYLIVVNDNTIQLADTEAHAQAGIALAVDATGASSTQTFTPLQGSSTAATIALSQVGTTSITLPAHGYVNGEAVTYTTTGKEIGGLSNAGIYYVIVVDSNTIKLAGTAADAFAGNAITLDPTVATGTHSLSPVQAPVLAVSFNPSAVRPAGSTFTLPSHGFVTGEAVTYTTTGTPPQGLTPGTTYYVIVVDSNTIRLAATQADANNGVALTVDPTAASGTQTLSPSKPVLQLAASTADATAAPPVVLSLGGAIDFGEVENTVMSGTEHTLTAFAAPGIVIKATLAAVDGAKTKSGLGGDPTIQDLLTKPELSGQAGNTLTNLRNVYGVTPGKAGKLPTPIGSPISGSIKNAQGLAPNESETPAQYSIAGSLGLIVTNFTVTAEVGSDAVLKSWKNVTVEATITEKQQTSVEATISKPASKDKTALSLAVGLEVGVFNATAHALVDSNATIDAAGSLTVHATTTYPFVFPFRDPSSSNLTKTFGSNPLNTIAGPFLSGNLGLQTFFVNNWTRTVSKPGGGAPMNEVGVALTLDVNDYTNSAVASIGSGARINQDPVYQTSQQSVAVAAQTYIDEINITGMFDANLNPDGAVKAIRKRTILDVTKEGNPLTSQHAYEQIFSLFGNRSGSVGLGVSAPITVITTTATAVIDSGALVHIGSSGSLSDKANDRNFFLILAQSGGQAKTVGFSGTVSVLSVTANTTAQIQGGVTVTGGGAVNVSANDDSNLINLTGAFQTSQQVSIGADVAINVLDRNTLAIIGDEESSPTATDTPTGRSAYGSLTTPLGNLTLSATETGNLITSAIAASVASDEPPSPALGGSVSADFLQGTQAKDELEGLVSGIGVAGAASLNLLPADNVEAYINDAGTFDVGNVSVTANNASHIISATGAAAVSLAEVSAAALAGTYSQNTMIGATRAFIDGATLDAGGFTLDAERSGFSFALSAGVAVSASESSASLAVALAVNTITSDSEAFLRNVSATLVGDANIRAQNDDQIWALNGAVSVGVSEFHSYGVGAAVSVNIVNDQAHAYAADSVISQAGGALTVSAADQNFGAVDARILALTAAVGASTTSAAAGTISINHVGDDTEAYLLGTTYGNTTAGMAANVTASGSSGIIALAGAVGIGGMSGYGIAAGFNFINDTTKAYLEGTVANLLGDVNIVAASTSVIGSMTLGVAGGTADSTKAGSISVNQISDTIGAHISRAAAADPSSTTGNVSSVQTSGNVVVSAADTSVLASVAGGVAIAGVTGSAIGAALSYNAIQNTLTAYVDSTTLATTQGGVSVSADSTPILVSFAAGGAGAGGFAFGGSLTINAIANTVNADVSNSTISALNSVSVTASESPVMVVLAGGIGISLTSSAVGAAIAYNFIGGSFDPGNPDHVTKPSTANDQVSAAIENSSVTATSGDVTVLAGYYQTPPMLPGTAISLPSVGTVTLPVPVSKALVSIAIGGAGGDTFALGGSLNVNLMRGSSDAHITSNVAGKQIQAGGNVVVATGDSSTIGSAAGALAIGGGGGAVGAAISANDIKNTMAARIEGVTVSGQQVQVGATEKALIVNVTAAGAGAQFFALGGSLSVNLIRDAVDAHISSGANVTGSSGVSVTATDTPTIGAGSGAGAFAIGNANAAAGVALAVNDIANTTSATIAGSTTDVTAPAGDFVVSAQSTPTITTVAAGVAVAVNPDPLDPNVAVAGSSAVNVMANHVDASIDAATVAAYGNVLVLAKTGATLNTFAGTVDGAAYAGAGGAVVVNHLGNDTEATIDDGAHVTAEGNGPAIGVDQWANDTGADSLQDIHGLAIIASTQENIVDIAATVSGSPGLGVSLNFEVNVFADTTDAAITNSTINAAGDLGQDVIVRAHDETDVASAGGAVTVGIAGVGAVVDTDVYTSTTQASIAGSTVYAGGDVEASAMTREKVTSATAGATLGGGTLAGGASGVNIGGATTVSIAGSQVYSHGNLTVRANDIVTLNLGDGVASGGLAAGAGGAFAVALDSHTTSATIVNSTTDATGTTLVEADSTESLLDVAITAGVGGAVGLAGAIGVASLSANVTAAIIASNVNQDDSYKNQNQNVTVKAKDNASVTDGIGSLAGSVVAGIGAGVDVISVKDVVDAYIGDNSNVEAGGNITVEADGAKSFSSNVFSFAVAGGASLNATVSVVGIGAGLDSQGASQINQNTLATVNNDISLSGGAPGLNTNNDQGTAADQNAGLNYSTATDQNAQQLTTTGAMDVSGAFSTDQTPHDTESYVGHNVTLTAGGDISVTANETLNGTALAGQGQGAILSVGASVAVVDINSAVLAFVQDGTSINAGGAVTVASHFTDDVRAKSFAGTAGFLGTLGVQVAVITDNAAEIATLGNVQLNQANTLTVDAAANRTLDAEAAGGSAAAVAAGVAVASASANGSTTASLGGLIGQAPGESVGAVTVSAASTDSVRSLSVAVAAGVLPAPLPIPGAALTVNTSDATIDPNVTAAINDNAAITSTGTVLVNALQTPHADAEAVGVDISTGAALGADQSNANVAGTTSSYLGNFVTVSAPALWVVAERSLDANNDPTAHSTAGAGVGGLLVGVDGAGSTATSGGTVQATTGTSVMLPDGNVTIQANNHTLQSANATGVAVGGLLAIGVDTATASSNVTTLAQLGSGAITHMGRTGDLTVVATGTDENDVSSTAGSGGIIAGDASIGNTGDSSTVSAILGGPLANGAMPYLFAGTMNVSAANNSVFMPDVSSVNAALAGASGAAAFNTDDISANATVLSNTVIMASNAVDITAQNSFTENLPQGGNTVSAGAGGVINGTAATSTTTLAGNANVTVGSGVAINVENPVSQGANNSGIFLIASSVLNTNDNVTLSTGGGIEGAGTNSSLTATLNNNVTTDSTAAAPDNFVANQDIGIGTYSIVHAVNTSEANTWGVIAAVASSSAQTDVTSNQTVMLGPDTNLTTPLNIKLTAGDNPTPGAGAAAPMTGDSNAQSYSRSLVAIPACSATTILASNANLTVGSGDQIESGENTTLAADPGTPSPTAVGIGHGYELFFIPVTNGSSTTSAPTSSNVTINGTVTAGIYHQLNITIPNDSTASDANGYAIYSNTVNVNGVASATAGTAPGATLVSSPTFAAFTASFDPSFNPENTIQNAANLGEFPDPGEAQALEGAVYNGPVGAMVLGPLFAAGGDVIVNAGALQGGGAITAYGGPTITVTNNSPDYLVLSSVNIPDEPGGHVVYTGTAISPPPALTVVQSGSGARPIVNIQELYNNPVPSPSTSTNGPSVFVTATMDNQGNVTLDPNGFVDNEAGQVAITVADGSLIQAGSINASQVNLTTQKGITALSNPNGLAANAGTPATAWDSAMYWPDGYDPYTSLSMPTNLQNIYVAYVANALFNANGQYGTDTGASSSAAVSESQNFTQNGLIGHAGETPPSSYLTPAVSNGQPYGAYNVPATPQLVNGQRPPATSLIFLGSGAGAADATQAGAASESPYNGAYAIINSPDPASTWWFPVVPVEPLPVTTANTYPSITASLTSGSESVTVTSSVAGLTTGESVTGTGIAPGTTIQVSSVGFSGFALDPTTLLVTNVAALKVGQTVSGNGIQPGTTIQQVIAGILSFVVLSAPATFSGSENLTATTVTLSSPATVTGTETLAVGTGSLINAAGVFITAKYVDVNAPINVGQPNNWSVSLPATLNSTIQQDQTDYSQGIYSTTAGDARGFYTLPASTLSPGDAQITAQYDAITGQIIVNNVSAASGGFISLDGAIMSTNPLGQLNVHSDLGSVTIDNETSYSILVNNVSASRSATSNSLSGVDIIDTNQPAAVQQTLYVYQPGNVIDVYQGTAGQTQQQLQQGPSVAVIQGNSTTYSPEAGLRWDWQLQTDLSRNFIGNTSELTPWNFTLLSGATQSNPWYYLDTPNGDVSNGTTNPTGWTYVDTQSESTDFRETISGSVVRWQDYWAAVYHNGNYGFAPTNPVVYDYTNDPPWGPNNPRSEDPWAYYDVMEAELTLTESVKADNPIGIDFSGPARATVNITSPNAPVILGGNITNPVGDTAITAPSVTQEPSATLTTHNLTLTANTGGVGAATQPINASLTAGGVLNAQAGNQGVYVNLHSDAIIGQVQSGNAQVGYGPVNIHATDSLDANSSSKIIGSDITLTSDTGEVGNASAPLPIQATGVVNVAALGDIGLTQTAGDLKVGQIVSTLGNVTINVPSGAICNASGTAWANLVSNQASQQIWQNLNLTNPSGAAWTTAQLTNPLAQVAVDPAAGNVVGITAPNISGANVTLVSGQSVGQVGSSGTFISAADLQAGVALPSATAPGDVLLVGTVGGTTVTVPFGQEPTGFTLTGVLITPDAQLYVSASGTATLTATGSIAIQSTAQDLTLDKVAAGGTVNIAAPGSILSNGSAGSGISTCGNVVLKVDTGTVGSPTALVNVEGVCGSVSVYTPPGGAYLKGVVIITSVTHPAATEGINTGTVTVATFTDNSDISNLSAIITWADGQTSAGTVVATGTPGSYTVTGSHTYAEEIKTPSNFTVAVKDSARPPVSKTISTATVADAGLSITSVTHPAAAEGISTGTVTVATFTDAAGSYSDINDLSAIITWADGQTSAGTVVATSTPGSYTVTGGHTYAEEINTASNFTVAVSDNGGSSASQTITTATVADAGLTVTSVTHPAATEGVNTGTVTVATFTDAAGSYSDINDLSATITWADGQTSAGTVVATSTPGSYTVTGSHTYAEEIKTPSNFTVAVKDSGGSSASSTINTATVADAIPVAGAITGPTNVIPGQQLPLSAPFTDTGKLDTHTGTFVWGDGTSTTVNAVEANGSGTVSSTHIYAASGTYTVTLTVTDDEGTTSAPVSFTVTVTQSAFLLSSNASGAFTASDNAVMNIPGYLVVDSNSSTALIASGKASITANQIIVVGGDQVSGQASLNPNPILGGAAVADPLAFLSAPGVTGTPIAIKLAGKQSQTISPGIYSKIKVSGQASLTMLPGVYVIAGGGFSVSGNASVTGSGVMIYNAGSGYSYNATTGVVSDGGTFGSISLGGNGTINLSAPASGQPYTGVILFQSRSNTSALSLGGNGTAGTLGTIYAPAAAAGLSGNAQLTSTLVVSTLSVTGNAGAFQLAGGASSEYAASTSNWITDGILTVSVQDGTGNGLDANALARLDNAMSYLDQTLGSFGVYLSWAAPGTSADVHIHFASSTPEGGVSDGVLGFTTPANDVYFVTGWHFYTGTDPSQIDAGQYDFRTLATHELAHTVGLGESADANSVMDEYLTPGTVRRTFTDSNLALINTDADRFKKAALLPVHGSPKSPVVGVAVNGQPAFTLSSAFTPARVLDHVSRNPIPGMTFPGSIDPQRYGLVTPTPGLDGDDVFNSTGLNTSTTYDQKLAALDAIMAEWGSTDSYSTRLTALAGYLNTNTVHDNYINGVAVVDQLLGNKYANEWFFAGVNDYVKGTNNNDVITTIQ